MLRPDLDRESFERQATEVADILRAIANERRLMILCKLVEWGEANVTTLAEAVGLLPWNAQPAATLVRASRSPDGTLPHAPD